MTDPQILSPPPDWQPVPPSGPVAFFLPAADVMTNFDHSIDQAVAELLRAGDRWAYHSAANFHGVVWFDGGRWHEQVFVHRVPQGSLSAGTLEDLMKLVNDEYGWR